MWRSRRWRHLLNIIDRLPRHSAFAESLADDDELATVLARMPQRDGVPSRRMREWSPEVELLSVLGDRIAELIQAVGATKGAKPRQVRALPRPVTAMQRRRAAARKDKHKSLVARLLPGRSAGPETDEKR